MGWDPEALWLPLILKWLQEPCHMFYNISGIYNMHIINSISLGLPWWSSGGESAS